MVRLSNLKNYLVESLDNCKFTLDQDLPKLKLKKGDVFTFVDAIFDEKGEDLLVVKGYVKIFKIKPEHLQLMKNI